MNVRLVAGALSSVLATSVFCLDVGAQELVVDLASGHGSGVQYLVEYREALYFTGYDQRRGSELWRYDPSDGASLLADIYPGEFNSSAPAEFTVSEGILYFEASSGPETGRELWAYDGDATPYLVADLAPGEECSCPQELVDYDGRLVFATYPRAGNTIWTLEPNGVPEPLFSDGRAPGNPRDFVVLGDRLYFSARDEQGDQRLWHYDGSNLPELVFPDPGFAEWKNGEGYTAFNGGLVYASRSDMWFYDLQSDPVRVASSEYQGDQPGSPSGFAVFDGRVLFSGLHPDFGFELWEWDGAAEPFVVADISAGQDWTEIQALTVAHDVLYFGGDEQLWAYDGSSTPWAVDGVRMPGEIGMIAFQDEIVFPAYSDETGFEIWSYDGQADPGLFIDTDLSGDANPANLTATSDALFFTVSTDAEAVYRFDGTDTVRIPVTGSEGAVQPSAGFVEWNDAIYFVAQAGDGAREIHKVETGSASELQAVIDDGTAGVASTDHPEQLVVYDGSLYFAGGDGANGIELWTWDGNGSPAIAADILPGPASSMPRWLTTHAGSLYFGADDAAGGSGLWKFTPGSGAVPVLDAEILVPPVVHDDRLYVRGKDVWELDGSNEPVRISVGSASSTYERSMASVGRTLYFPVDPVQNHQQLRAYTRGTGGGNVDFGVDHRTIEEPAAAGSSVCFRGFRSAHDPELECYDPARDQLFRFDLNPYGFSAPGGFTEFGEHLYFSADDGIHGTELYRLPMEVVSSGGQDPDPSDPGSVSVAVYPNPVGAELTVAINADSESEWRITIHDAIGREIVGHATTGPLATRSTRVDVSALPSGVYFVRVSGASLDVTVPVVKRR